MKPLVLWHGGAGGLWRGGIIKPDMAEHRYVEGCPHCEAQRNGTWAPGEDPGIRNARRRAARRTQEAA